MVPMHVIGIHSLKPDHDARRPRRQPHTVLRRIDWTCQWNCPTCKEVTTIHKQAPHRPSRRPWGSSYISSAIVRNVRGHCFRYPSHDHSSAEHPSDAAGDNVSMARRAIKPSSVCSTSKSAGGSHACSMSPASIICVSGIRYSTPEPSRSGHAVDSPLRVSRTSDSS